MSVNSEIVDQVRSLLNQGYKITTEHANSRRFKTKSWLTGSTLEGTRTEQVISQLESILAEHRGEYVRLIGVDTNSKSRVLEAIVQRPDGSQPSPSKSSTVISNNWNGSSSNVTNGKASVDGDIHSQVRSLLNQGCKVGAEHASKRRFKTKSWQTCPPIDSTRESEVIRALEACMADHSGEYVRLVGIDPQQKRRVAEVIIQRPGDTASNTRKASSNSSYSSSVSSNGLSKTSLQGNLAQQVSSLLAQGCKIGTEHATKRRFKTKSWQTCAPIDSIRESEVIRALEACMADHSGEYVRLVGIDPQQKRRVAEIIIQRPETQQATASTSNQTSSYSSYSNNGNSATSSIGLGSNSLSSDAIAQIKSLLNQGYKIGTEHADKRRFRTKSWQSCAPIDSTRESDVIRALEACIAEHKGEYVRLVGIDTQQKRRVAETIIQRP